MDAIQNLLLHTYILTHILETHPLYVVSTAVAATNCVYDP